MISLPSPQDQTQLTELAPRERVTSWLSRLAPVAKVLIWLLGGAVILTLTWVGYEATSPNTLAREVVVSGFGAALTVLSAAAVAVLTLFSQWRKQREYSVLRRFDDETWRRQSLHVGRMKIPDIVVLASGNCGREWTQSVGVQFTRFMPSRVLPAELQGHRDAVLAAVQERAAAAGAPVTDDACVDLVGSRIAVNLDSAGERRRSYLLAPARASYFDFIGTTANLDASVADGPTLRSRIGPTPHSLAEVEGLPVMAKLGVGAAVVTKDNRLVLGIRGKTVIAGALDETKDRRSRVHVVAEGVIPSDIDGDGLLNPRVTAQRGLYEELSVGNVSSSVAVATELLDTGFFFDQLRLQPCFAYVAKINHTWDQLQSVVPTACDYWEFERIESLPFDIHHEGVRQLVMGVHPDLVFASNHAAAVVWFALLYEHGLTEMRDQLSLPPGAAR